MRGQHRLARTRLAPLIEVLGPLPRETFFFTMSRRES